MTDLLKFCDSREDSGFGIQDSEKIKTESRILNPESLMIAEARHWLGTPFRHQGRVKCVGVDCLGLLVGVAAELGLRSRTGERLADLDVPGYGHYPDAAKLRAVLDSALEPLSAPQPGSIGIFAIDGSAQHLGIFGSLESGVWSLGSQQTQDSKLQPLSLIHAYAPARKVVEHGFTKEWKARLVAVFKIDNPSSRLSSSDSADAVRR